MLKNGVILDVRRSHIVVLTKDGEFLKGHKEHAGYEIGSEVSFRPMEKRSIPTRIHPKWAAGFALAAVLFICAVITFPLFSPAAAFAYISFDVNPSIEFAIDKKGRVIAAEPFNEDAENVLKEMDNPEKRPIDDVALEWMRALERLGYMKQDSRVVVGTVPADKEASALITRFVSQFEGHHAGMDITIIKATENERETAADFGVTAGKYMLDKQPQGEKPEDQLPPEKPDMQEKPAKEEEDKETGSPVPPAAPQVNTENQQDDAVKQSGKREKEEQEEREEKEKAERKAKEEQRKQQKEQQKQAEKQQKELQKQAEKQQKELRKKKEELEKRLQKAKEEREKQEEKRKKEQEKQQKKNNKDDEDDDDDDD